MAPVDIPLSRRPLCADIVGYSRGRRALSFYSKIAPYVPSGTLWFWGLRALELLCDPERSAARTAGSHPGMGDGRGGARKARSRVDLLPHHTDWSYQGVVDSVHLVIELACSRPDGTRIVQVPPELDGLPTSLRPEGALTPSDTPPAETSGGGACDVDHEPLPLPGTGAAASRWRRQPPPGGPGPSSSVRPILGARAGHKGDPGGSRVGTHRDVGTGHDNSADVGVEKQGRGAGAAGQSDHRATPGGDPHTGAGCRTGADAGADRDSASEGPEASDADATVSADKGGDRRGCSVPDGGGPPGVDRSPVDDQTAERGRGVGSDPGGGAHPGTDDPAGCGGPGVPLVGPQPSNGTGNLKRPRPLAPLRWPPLKRARTTRPRARAAADQPPFDPVGPPEHTVIDLTGHTVSLVPAPGPRSTNAELRRCRIKVQTDVSFAPQSKAAQLQDLMRHIAGMTHLYSMMRVKTSSGAAERIRSHIKSTLLMLELDLTDGDVDDVVAQIESMVAVCRPYSSSPAIRIPPPAML